MDCDPMQGPSSASKEESDPGVFSPACLISTCIPGVTLKVINVVSCFDVGCPLDLIRVNSSLRNAEYIPKNFNAVVTRIVEPRTTAMICESGKIVVTGARSEAETYLASKQYVTLLQKNGFNDAEFRDFTIINMVASCDVTFPVDIEQLFKKHHQFCTYEPEVFPKLLYKLVTPNMIIVVDADGQVVLAGAKETGELAKAIEQVYPILTDFKK